jgi:cytosine deaminase
MVAGQDGQSALALRNARVADRDSLVDVVIDAGRIVHIGSENAPPVEHVIDLEGRVVLPGLVEPHTHLDKALTRDRAPNRSGTLAEAIQRNHEFSTRVTQEDVYERAREVALWASRCGTTTLRTHANVDEYVGLKGIYALLQLREDLRNLMDIQIVALPFRLLGSDARRSRELFAEAIAAGADAVGGAPLVDYDQRAFVDQVFHTALHYDLPIDLHVDESESPEDFVLGYVAQRTLEERYQRRVIAGHCCSLSAVDDRLASATIAQVAQAEMSVVTLPSANLYLQGRKDRQPIRRGITRVKDLIAAGVNVVCGADNVKDMFNPFGRPDPVFNANLLGHVAQMGGWDEQHYLLESITVRAAAAVGLSNRLEPGAPADLVAFDSYTYRDVLSDLPWPLYVVKRGSIMTGAQGGARSDSSARSHGMYAPSPPTS